MTIRYEKRGKVALFTLDNPKVNALTPAMHKEFHDLLKAFCADREVHVGILTGAGERAFCGGDDIKHNWGFDTQAEILDAHFWPSREETAHLRPGWERELKTVERFKPIIGAINGAAMGMGFIYLLNHTDMRISVPGAKLGLPEVAYGMGGAGGTTQLCRHLPPAVAMWMLMTGEPLLAEDALHHGLINEIVPRERLLERAFEVAETIAAHPPIAVRVEMELAKKSMELSKQDSLALASHLYRLQRAAYLAQPGTTATPLATGGTQEQG